MLYTPTGYTLDLVVLERSSSSVLEDGLSSYLPSGRWIAPSCVLLSVIAWRLAPVVLAPSRSLLFLPLPSGQLSAKSNQSTWSTNKCTLQSHCEPLHTVITQCHIQGYTYHKVTSQQVISSRYHTARGSISVDCSSVSRIAGDHLGTTQQLRRNRWPALLLRGT